MTLKNAIYIILILIGDWDQHAKQWGWVITKTDSLYSAIPLSTHRDNAFFNINGLINQIILNKDITPHLQSFEHDVDYIGGLVYDFDVYFLQDTTTKDFIAQAKFFQTQLNDEQIESAFKVWDTRIYDLDARTIIEKIKSRRNNLVTIAERFKDILDKKSLLTKPLKGSEDMDIESSFIQCFEC